MRLSAIIKPRTRYLVDSKSRDFSPSPIIIIIIIPRTIERSPRVAITAASGYLIARVDCYLFSTLFLSLCAAWPSSKELSRGSQFFSLFFSFGERTSRLRTRAWGIGGRGRRRVKMMFARIRKLRAIAGQRVTASLLATSVASCLLYSLRYSALIFHAWCE